MDNWKTEGSLVIGEDRSGINLFTLYMEEAGNHELLSRKRERELFTELDQVWPARHEGNLDKNWEIPPIARPITNEVARCNYRLVLALAFKHHKKSIQISDLVQEGNLGLVQAIRKFNLKKKTRFSTYATFWIRQAMGRAVANHSRTIRLPVHVHDRILRINQAKFTLAQELGREPTGSEISD